MNKPIETIKCFEYLMRSPRTSNDTSCVRHKKDHSSIEEGESSKIGEKRNAKSKGKPTCHHCGRLRHTANISRNKNGMKNSKPKFTASYFD